MIIFVMIILLIQTIIFSLIYIASPESYIIHYGLMLAISAPYVLILTSSQYNLHSPKLRLQQLLTWPFTILEIYLFYNLGWYDMTVLWILFSYISTVISPQQEEDSTI